MAGDLKAQLEISADASGVDAGIKSAKRSLSELGVSASAVGRVGAEGFGNIAKASKVASKQIDDYVRTLQSAAATNGLSTREAELYTLALRGASSAQLQAADSALKLSDAYERGQVIGEKFHTALKAIALVSIAAAAGAAVGFQKLANSAASYKDLSEQIGDSASAVASLQVAADTSGKSLDSVAAFSEKLTKSLSKTDDEAKGAGKGLAALGLNFDDFKRKSPVAQLEAIAKALKGFDDGPGKTAALEAIAKGGAQLLPFLNDLGDQQERQIRLTDDQIKRADEYTKAQARAASQLRSLGEVIVVESLPAITSLTKGITEAISQIYKIDGAASDLKGNGAIGKFAEDAVLGFAKVIDFAATTVSALKIVAASVGQVFEDVKLAGAAAGIAGKLTSPGGIIQGINEIDDFKKQLAERNKNLAEYNAKLDSFLTGSTTRFQDAVQNQINTTKAGVAAIESTGKKIDTSSLITDKTKTGRTSTKGQVTERDLLGFDMAIIKRGLDELTNAYKDAESILEATRSAGLIGDRTYYESKRALINANEAAQEQALNRENVSLRESIDSRQGTDKERLDNEKKIQDNTQKIVDLRNRAATSLQVLSIQEQSAADKLAQSFLTARQAAQDYFDTIERQQARSLSGVGQGDKRRGFDAGINQIEDRYANERRSAENLRAQLEGEGKFTDDARKQYEERLRLANEFESKSISSYTAYYGDLTAKQSDWALGANEALQNYQDKASNTFDLTKNVVEHAFKGMEDSLVNFITTGKGGFKSLVDSIVADIIRITVQQQLLKPLSAYLQGGSSSAGASGSLLGTAIGLAGSFFGGTQGAGPNSGVNYQNGSDLGFDLFAKQRAIGGPVSKGSLYQVNEKGPGEILNVRGNQYLMAGADGSVSPASTSGGTKSQTNVFNFTLNEPASKQTQSQVAAAALNGIRSGQRNT